jgi:hypothetical protein
LCDDDGAVRRWRIGSREGGRERVFSVVVEVGVVFEGGRSRRPVVYTGFGVKVIIVGSGGGGVGELGELRSFLCASRRVVRVCWRFATRVKGVMDGKWRWARRMIAEVS